MKNVLKRLIELINLFGDDTKISTNKIKDSIPDYRDLNEQAFRRAFERDKSLLRSFGYLIEYSNDKWSHDESGGVVWFWMGRAVASATSLRRGARGWMECPRIPFIEWSAIAL